MSIAPSRNRIAMKKRTPASWLMQDSVKLKKLITTLLADVRPAHAEEMHINLDGIPAYLAVSANRDKVTAVLNRIITTMALYMERIDLTITAQLEEHIITITFKGPHRPDVFGIGNQLQAVQPIMDEVGGYLSITSQQEEDTTIVMGFPVV